MDVPKESIAVASIAKDQDAEGVSLRTFDTWHFSPVVEALQARRGVPCPVAVTTVAALGDLTRFDTPRQRMLASAHPLDAVRTPDSAHGVGVAAPHQPQPPSKPSARARRLQRAGDR